VTLNSRQTEAFSAHAAGNLSDRELLDELVRIAATAREYDERLDELDAPRRGDRRIQFPDPARRASGRATSVRGSRPRLRALDRAARRRHHRCVRRVEQSIDRVSDGRRRGVRSRGLPSRSLGPRRRLDRQRRGDQCHVRRLPRDGVAPRARRVRRRLGPADHHPARFRTPSHLRQRRHGTGVRRAPADRARAFPTPSPSP